MRIERTNERNQVRPVDAGRTVPVGHARLWQRNRWLLLTVFVVLPLLIFWRPLQRQYLTHLLLRSDAPSPEVLSDIIQQTGDAQSLLLRLWQTQRIPHRQFVLGHLGRIANSEPAIFHAMETVVLDATADPDITTRELAFAALARTKHPQLRRLALEQLDDADPAVRVLGLQSLRSVASSNDVPIAMRLLSDPDPRVVVSVALVLRQVTGNDFGIKSSLALPRFTSIDKTNAAPPADLAAINQSVQRWRDWWTGHQNEYPKPLESSGVPHQPARLTARGFTLDDADAKPVRLSDYHGKVVLLAFWNLDSPVSLDDAPALNAIHSGNAWNATVLGIRVPPAPSCASEHEPANGHEHHNHHAESSPALNTAEARGLVHNAAQERQIKFPMLIDVEGELGLRFAVEELPTYALIDSQGLVRRRFVGNRSKAVFEAMLRETANSKPQSRSNK
jgi:peroxiredoxin